MNSIVLNIDQKETELIKRLKYNIEKAGFEVTEEYSNDLLILVFSKKL